GSWSNFGVRHRCLTKPSVKAESRPKCDDSAPVRRPRPRPRGAWALSPSNASSGLGPRQTVPVRGPAPLWPLEPRVRLLRVRRLLLRARAVARRELRFRVQQLLVLRSCTDHQDHARAVAGAHEDMLGAGGTVEEVPRPEEPL